MSAADMHAMIDARAKQLHSMVDLTLKFDSGLTSIVGRNTDETVKFVAVFAVEEDAADLQEFLARRDAEQ